MNKHVIMEKFDKMFEEIDSDDYFFTGGVDQDKIAELEAKLKVNLPDSYKWFLSKYGYMLVFGYEILGISKNGDTRLLDIQKFYKEKGLPDGYVVIMDDDDYYAYFLDTNQMSDGECGVVQWHPEAGVIRVYEDFYNFLSKKILQAYEDIYF